MNRALTLWKFARPHTVIGTLISIFTLYLMVCSGAAPGSFQSHIPLLILAFCTGLFCNIYIVGINQVEDIELDKINKPELPLASGELNIKQARFICWFCFAAALILGVTISLLLLAVVSFSMFMGWAYSRPPFYLRKHHLPAAIAIASVRGVMVNAGAFLVFSKEINGFYEYGTDIQILTGFVVFFTIVIAWFKDLPDMRGDAEFRIRSLALLKSVRFTHIAGSSIIIVAYVVSIIWLVQTAGLNSSVKYGTLIYGHIILLLVFISYTVLSKKNSQTDLRKFYKRFWLFFFAEYSLYLIAHAGVISLS